MDSLQLTPSNDFLRTILIEDIDPTTFATVPVTTGVVTAFFATSNDPSAQAADPTLSVNVIHVGVANPTPTQFPLGTWAIFFDAATLKAALLESLFGVARVAYLVVVRPNHMRVVDPVPFARARAADTATVVVDQ